MDIWHFYLQFNLQTASTLLPSEFCQVSYPDPKKGNRVQLVLEEEKKGQSNSELLAGENAFENLLSHKGPPSRNAEGN